jgi:hypothetical protein
MYGRISPPEQRVHQVGVIRDVEINELGKLDFKRSIKVALDDSSLSRHHKRDDQCLLTCTLISTSKKKRETNREDFV